MASEKSNKLNRDKSYFTRRLVAVSFIYLFDIERKMMQDHRDNIGPQSVWYGMYRTCLIVSCQDNFEHPTCIAWFTLHTTSLPSLPVYCQFWYFFFFFASLSLLIVFMHHLHYIFFLSFYLSFRPHCAWAGSDQRSMSYAVYLLYGCV